MQKVRFLNKPDLASADMSPLHRVHLVNDNFLWSFYLVRFLF
jgi:hypothetical protein